MEDFDPTKPWGYRKRKMTLIQIVQSTMLIGAVSSIMFCPEKKDYIITEDDLWKTERAFLDMNKDGKITPGVDYLVFGYDTNQNKWIDKVYLHPIHHYTEKDGTLDVIIDSRPSEIWYDRSNDGLFDWIVTLKDTTITHEKYLKFKKDFLGENE